MKKFITNALPNISRSTTVVQNVNLIKHWRTEKVDISPKLFNSLRHVKIKSFGGCGKLVRGNQNKIEAAQKNG